MKSSTPLRWAGTSSRSTTLSLQSLRTRGSATGAGPDAAGACAAAGARSPHQVAAAATATTAAAVTKKRRDIGRSSVEARDTGFSATADLQGRRTAPQNGYPG